MNIVEEAFLGLYPEREFAYEVKLRYSAKFNAYNANVKFIGRNLEFNLSRKWKEVSREICIGLIQSLILKMLKDNKKTTNLDMYHIFLRNLHKVVPKTESDPCLESAFNRVNKAYFHGLLRQPNLIWGESSRRTLGRYEYGSDTVRISSVLKSAPQRLIDYVMYHELLHKKIQFTAKGVKSRYHTQEFREKERQFDDQKTIETELRDFVRRKKHISFFGF